VLRHPAETESTTRLPANTLTNPFFQPKQRAPATSCSTRATTVLRASESPNTHPSASPQAPQPPHPYTPKNWPYRTAKSNKTQKQLYLYQNSTFFNSKSCFRITKSALFSSHFTFFFQAFLRKKKPRKSFLAAFFTSLYIYTGYIYRS
jgi:hypothetical protein